MTKKKRIQRIIVSVAAAVMLAVTLTSVNTDTTTGNAASLKHIDEIVAAQLPFNILEIVPDTAAASFGYYIAGQEPIIGWENELAKKTSPAERTSYINELFGRLISNGIMGDSTTTPLQYTYSDGTNFYSEAYLVENPQNWLKLRLATPEIVTMTGLFWETQNGDYQAEYVYTQAADGAYCQNISRFEHTTAPVFGQGDFYYNPIFTLMDLEDIAPEFVSNWDKWADVAVYSYDEITGIYSYIATVEEIVDNGNGFDGDLDYYYVKETDTGAPGIDPGINTYKAIVSYEDQDDAPGDGYTSVPGTGHFSRSITSYMYVGTGGNFSFTPNVSGDAYNVKFRDVFYKAGYKNNNLFKQHVLGLADPANNPEQLPDYNALSVTVNVKQAGNVTEEDISAASLIYISTGTAITDINAQTSYGATDIPDTSAALLYNYAAYQSPLILDYSIIQGITEATPAGQLSNIQKLCLLSLQPGIETITGFDLSGLVINWTDLAYVANDIDKTFVNNNVYCFNKFNTASISVVPDIDNPAQHDIFYLASDLYTDAFTQEVYSSGFSAVLTEIQNENFLKQIAGEDDLLPENVTVSAAIRHVINFKGQRQTNAKTSIKVLDLEPAKVTSSTWLTPSTVRGWINNTLPLDKITVVHMTTGEFIGKIEDINETYDMIYIGMSTESLNTVNSVTAYNDTTMNGLVYSNIGDKYIASLELAGIREQDYIYVNGTKAINGATGTTAGDFRFSGNDITETKVTELKKFVKAGYPIILADSFVAGANINTNTVDSSSYMYEAVSGIFGKYPNVMTQAFAGNVINTDTVIKYLNVSKPAIDMTLKPVEYADDNNASIAADPNDGYYYLQYEISINNITDPTPVTTTYDCRLYIDLNADGRYSDNEALSDIEVHRVSDGALILPATNSATGAEYYTLFADIKYLVTRQMPDNYVGIIPWKLEVIKNNADHIHASTQGYTRIAAGSNKQTVKVLQIMQQGTSSTKLNLSTQLSSNPKGIYGQLIAGLADFNVTIEAIENKGTNSLEAKGSEQAVLDYLNKYDMLIIGFNDCYDGIGTYTAPAIVRYINEGKSVLFTHDTTSLSQVPAYNYPMAIAQTPQTMTLTSSHILYNTAASTYQNVRSSSPEVYWYGATNTAYPPAISSSAYQYVVFYSGTPSGSAETDYFAVKATSGSYYAVYKITGSTYTQLTSVTSSTSLATFKSDNNITTPILYVSCTSASGKFTNPNGNLSTENQKITATYNITKFVSGTKYNLNNYAYSYNYKNNGASSVLTSSYAAHLMCLYNGAVTNYTYKGTYNAGTNTYGIDNATWYPATGTAFPQSTLYASDPAAPLPYTLSTIPSNISDWGYLFNTIIRDAVGLDRYGVTSSIPVPLSDGSTQTLGKFVNVNAPLAGYSIDRILEYNRSVAYTPKSARSATVNEYQGYTNYALIRFAGSGNTYKYTNNTYTNRETTDVSQVNKGQITTYPYNVNTASFGGSNASIISYGGSYMKIGKTHEQYFQINMNTDDIVVWYCLSNGGTDGISYYDDVPNDCVNAYYIYNKGNVTYSGVGHSSNASLYGADASQEYVNEAKLFVNTMIAAYQSAAQAPSIAIKKDARGTSDTSEKYVITDNATNIWEGMSATDESRAVYYRLSDPNVGVDKTITVQYYIADANGTTVEGINEPVSMLVPDGASSLPLTTYNSNSVAVAMTDNNGVLETRLKGGYVYKLYLPNTNCLDRLNDEDVYSIKIYIKVTTMIGSIPLTPAVDSIEIKKQQLFELS